MLKPKSKKKENIMSKFEKVQKSLMEVTKETNNWVTVTKNVDARHTGKYALQNVVTRNTLQDSYKTLDEIIKEFNLNI